MKTILFASTNAGKFHEVSQIAEEYGITVVPMKEIVAKRGAAPDVEEDGATYYENALLKARAYAAWSGMSVIADDTGLEVNALGGSPGVHSARYAGKDAEPGQNRVKLLAELSEVATREARFVCTLVNIDEKKLETSATATLEGEIARSPHGGGGFGYDSIFFLPEKGMTLAEAKEKGIVVETHRIKALRELFDKLTR